MPPLRSQRRPLLSVLERSLEATLMPDYQEGFRDGLRAVLMWMMQNQFSLAFPPELIEWLGDRVQHESGLLTEMREEEESA
mgnify:FL=1